MERCERDAALAGGAEVRAEGDALADAVGGELALRWRIAAVLAAPGYPDDPEVGGALALRWRLAVVKALIASPPDGDAVREAYGELVDRYRGDPDGLARLRPLGDEIRRLEADGTLPSALVVRSERRPRR